MNKKIMHLSSSCEHGENNSSCENCNKCFRKSLYTLYNNPKEHRLEELILKNSSANQLAKNQDKR